MTRNTAARGISPSPPQPPMGTPRDAARSAVSAAGSSRRAAELRPPRCHPRCAATGPGKGLRSAGAEPQPQPGDAPGSPAPRGQPPPTTPAPHSPHRTAPLRRRPPPPRGSPAHGGVIHAAPASLKTRSRTPAAPPPPAAPGLSFAAQLCPTAAAGGGAGCPPPSSPASARCRAPRSLRRRRRRAPSTARCAPLRSPPLRPPPPPRRLRSPRLTLRPPLRGAAPGEGRTAPGVHLSLGGARGAALRRREALKTARPSGGCGSPSISTPGWGRWN